MVPLRRGVGWASASIASEEAVVVELGSAITVVLRTEKLSD
jgi:hypothetical protein